MVSESGTTLPERQLIPVSAIEAVSPAIEWTRRLLFRPFRFGLWVRFAVLGFLTGEMSSGGFHFSVPPLPHTHNSGADRFALPFSRFPVFLLPLIALLAVAFVVFFLLFAYLGSVFRFVLLESVVAGQARLREGFGRWRKRSVSLFLWQLVYSLSLWTAIAATLGVPLLLGWRAGVFKHPDSHLGTLIVGGILLFCAFVLILVIGMTIWVLTEDLVVPIMALEHVGPVEAWRRLLPMLRSQKGSYAGYVGMKVVLALAAGVLQGIAGIVIVLILLIPTAITALVAFLVAHAVGLTWNVFTITAAVVTGAVLLALLFFLITLATDSLDLLHAHKFVVLLQTCDAQRHPTFTNREPLLARLAP